MTSAPLKNPGIMKKFWIGVLFLGLVGCATMPDVMLNTPSGRPEVSIQNATKKQVMDAIINRELSKSWDLKSQSDSLLVFSHKVTGFAAALAYGSQYDSTPEQRGTFTLVDSGNVIRVLLKVEMVTNPGSAYERTSDVTLGKNAAPLQTTLEEIKASLTPLKK